MKKLMIELRKTKKAVLCKVADKLDRSRRIQKGINLWRIGKLTKEGDAVVIPGKVLATGELDHKVTVIALSFSGKAAEKIKAAKGEAIELKDAVKNVPKKLVLLQ
jgi:large subunit ribosomal protein L18e